MNIKKLFLVLLVCLAGQPLHAQTDWRTRYESTVKNYEALPKPPENGVVVTGNSNIVMWGGLSWGSIYKDLSPMPIIPRGFGGSTTAELDYYLERLVLTYNPRFVVISEGENDFGRGYTPQQITDLHRKIINRIWARRWGTRIFIIGLKPSPLRWSRWPQFEDTNNRLRSLCATDSRLVFIHVGPVMIGSDGKPRRDYFRDDLLHLNSAGYKAWTSVVRPPIINRW